MKSVLEHFHWTGIFEPMPISSVKPIQTIGFLAKKYAKCFNALEIKGFLHFSIIPAATHCEVLTY